MLLSISWWLLCAIGLFFDPAYGQCQNASSAAFSHAPWTPNGLHAQLIFGGLSTPRGIKFDGRGNLLVVERTLGLSAFMPRNDSSCVGWERKLVIDNTALTHGIELYGKDLYVSSQTQVLLYKYDAASLSTVATPIVVVDGLPSDGELPARTLLLVPGPSGVPSSLFVSDGPLDNIDPTASNPANGRSEIRQFALKPSSYPYSWTILSPGAKLIAYGIRNAAGLSLSPKHSYSYLTRDTLWAVENGASLNVVIGNNGSTDNPADELEKIDLRTGRLGKSYGFPYCHTGFADLPAPWNVSYPGEQFSINNTLPGKGNDYCKNPKNNVPPTLLFEPHSVPLDIKFYDNAPAASGLGLPRSWAGDGFVSFHGSFDRVPPTGYGVVRVPWKKDGSGPVGSPTDRKAYEFIVQVPDLTNCPAGCIRPVGLAFDTVGRLFVSSDSTGEVFYIEKA